MNTFALVTITLLAITVCTAEDRGPRDSVYIALVEECQKSTKASDSDVKTFMARQMLTTKAGWCMVACIRKKAGVLNANNQIDLDKLKEVMAGLKTNRKDMYEKLIAMMTECKKQVESDPKNMVDECVVAEAIGKCILSK